MSTLSLANCWSETRIGWFRLFFILKRYYYIILFNEGFVKRKNNFDDHNNAVCLEKKIYAFLDTYEMSIHSLFSSFVQELMFPLI